MLLRRARGTCLQVDLESRVEAAEALVETLLASSRLAEAASVANKLSDTCLQTGLQMHHVRMLLLLAQIHQVPLNSNLWVLHTPVRVKPLPGVHMPLLHTMYV